MEEYIGTIRPWAINYAPRNWKFCDGSLLRISEYQALYSIIGQTFGGDGATNFALPDLRGRIPLGACPAIAIPLAAIGGAATVQLSQNQMPAHSHTLSLSVSQSCNTGGGTPSGSPVNNFPGMVSTSGATAYSDTPTDGAFMAPLDVTASEAYSGSNVPHNNMPPYLVCNYIICLEGMYPIFD